MITGPESPPGRPRIGLVSTYPPTRCGLAMFTASLRDALVDQRPGEEGTVSVVKVDAGDEAASSARDRDVVGTLDPQDPRSVASAAGHLSEVDVVVLQHEYGIFGPEEGRSVLDLVEMVDRPMITTLHTVPADPTPMQRRVLETLARTSEYMVALTETARGLLQARYRVPSSKTVVIPHGTRWSPVERSGPVTDPVLLTWGLLGPGKGIETALQAVEIARRDVPDIRYIVAGKTHPKVLRREGESYRRCLEEMRQRMELEDSVRFVDGYLSAQAMGHLLHSAALVVLPYDSTDQVVSGVLAEAVAAAVPVVATTFPHAVEVERAGAAVTVPHRDPQAMASALTGLLLSPERMDRMRGVQRSISPALSWAGAARRYEHLVDRVLEGTERMVSRSRAAR